MLQHRSIELSGAGVLQNISRYHAMLWDGLSAWAAMAVDIEAIQEADLAFIQLNAQTRGLPLTQSGPAPDPILQTLEHGGFTGPAPDGHRHVWLAQ